MPTFNFASAPNDERTRPYTYKKALADLERVSILNQNLTRQFPGDQFLAATVRHLVTRKNQLQKHILSGKK
ncbi:MAG: hypothetical protein LH609_22785 [Rudanella sp.]|nr:hypothetical protein [Rudanella sp.]